MTEQNAMSSASVGAADLWRRAIILFCNFFFIILAYYQIKAASRSLLLEFGGTASFPYVWIYSAVVLLGVIVIYHRLVERFSRIKVVLGSLALSMLLLVGFRLMLVDGSKAVAIAFYVFVDIFSVVLVEQFWSLTNSISRTEEGRRTYWLVSSGGLVGGLTGGLLAAALVSGTAMTTEDLLLSCAGLLLVTGVLSVVMWRAGLFEEVPDGAAVEADRGNWRALVSSRYLLLIAAVLCLTQLANPIIEYQFLSAIDAAYENKDERTVFISQFFTVLGVVSLGVNFTLTPLIHRYLGIVAGLMVQPLLIAASTLVFMSHSTLLTAAAMKLSDRGLSYSINRASKELLYIPVDPLHTYQAKAWIDMLGYRLFKVMGSGLILLTTVWLPVGSGPSLGALTLGVCALWLATIVALGTEYRRVSAPQPA
ncbi:MAG: ATP translocase [Gammaproteobacteria bacterium]|nr:ATP translocase [Gammaproteobacteria bacterium]NNM01064.1 ATP translocase [Gammaproteobacteria bacterium]